MISAAVTRRFGVIATDSAQYDTAQGKMSFQSQKLFCNAKYIMTFLGTNAYFAKIDKQKMLGDIPSLSIYLKDYLRKIRPEVTKVLSSEIADPDENKPTFCFLVLGVHKGLPTVVQFNSYRDFEPTYLFVKDKGVKFSTIYYGDDNPEKKELFKDATHYMEKQVAGWDKERLEQPGLIAEVLARGIYRKADAEEKIGPKKKYAGGIVNAAGILPNGIFFPLSGTQVA